MAGCRLVAARGAQLPEWAHPYFTVQLQTSHLLVPELVDTGQQGDRTVPHVARMVDKAVPHLHLSVLQQTTAAGDNIRRQQTWVQLW